MVWCVCVCDLGIKKIKLKSSVPRQSHDWRNIWDYIDVFSALHLFLLNKSRWLWACMKHVVVRTKVISVTLTPVGLRCQGSSCDSVMYCLVITLHKPWCEVFSSPLCSCHELSG